jgi:hypothetical protein
VLRIEEKRVWKSESYMGWEGFEPATFRCLRNFRAKFHHAGSIQAS